MLLFELLSSFPEVNKTYLCIYGESTIRHKVFCADSFCVSGSGDLAWILKQCGLESSGQRLISSNGKTKGIAFFWHFFVVILYFYIKKKKKKWFYNKFRFLRFLEIFKILHFVTFVNIFIFSLILGFFFVFGGDFHQLGPSGPSWS